MTKDEMTKRFKRVEQNQIWVVTKDLPVVPGSIGHPKDKLKRKVIIATGEYIEIRYASPWHFRTIDNEYFCDEDELIMKHCKPVGWIWHNVSFANKAKLRDIMNLGLYDAL